MADPPPKRIRLSNQIPKAVRDFVGCRTSELSLDLADTDWIPKLGGMVDVKSLEWADASKSSTSDNAGTLTAAVDTQFGSASIVVRVAIVQGQLALQADVQDAGVMGEMLEKGIGEAVTQWGRDLNADLRAEGKALDDIGFDKATGRLTFTKRALAVTETAMADPQPEPAMVAAAGVGSEAVVEPAYDSTEEYKAKREGILGKRTGLKALIGAGTVTGLAVAGFILFSDDNEIIERPPSEQSEASTGGSGTDEAADQATATGASWSAEDPSGDQTWVAARPQAGEANGCTDLIEATVTRTDGRYTVRIQVREGMTPEQVMERLDSKAIVVVGVDSSGNEQGWMWEWHNGELVDGSARDATGAADASAPAAKYTFEGDEVTVELPPTAEFTTIGVLGFSNPEMADPAEGAAWADELVVPIT